MRKAFKGRGKQREMGIVRRFKKKEIDRRQQGEGWQSWEMWYEDFKSGGEVCEAGDGHV